VDHHGVQRNDGHEPARRAAVGGARRQKPPVSVLMTGVEGEQQGASRVCGELKVESAELPARYANDGEKAKTQTIEACARMV
jgi:hypothetical protein